MPATARAPSKDSLKKSKPGELESITRVPALAADVGQASGGHVASEAAAVTRVKTRLPHERNDRLAHALAPQSTRETEGPVSFVGASSLCGQSRKSSRLAELRSATRRTG